jgi:hypothetical protein
MPRSNNDEHSEMDVEKTIESAGHSEDLVLRLVAEGVHSEEIHNTIKRNTDHLGIILGKQPVIDSNSPRLDGFRDAITLGETFISAE